MGRKLYVPTGAGSFRPLAGEGFRSKKKVDTLSLYRLGKGAGLTILESKEIIENFGVSWFYMFLEATDQDQLKKRLINQLTAAQSTMMGSAAVQSKKGGQAYDKWHTKILRKISPGSKGPTIFEQRKAKK